MTSPPSEPGPIRRMQTELAFPSFGRDDHIAAEDTFVDALERQMALLTASTGRGEGEAHVVIRQMVARALSDLMAAMHLARHGYLNQAYNAVRAAYESIDLAELVIKDPAEAARWVNTDEGYKEFAAGRVRERIGRESFDEMYSHYSELAHPRFEGSKLNTFGKRKVGEDRLQLVIQVGPTMLDEFPNFWFLAMSMVPTISRLMVATAGLIGMGEVTESRWNQDARGTAADLKRMAEVVEDGLRGFDIDSENFAKHFDSLDRIIEEVDAENPADPEPSAEQGNDPGDD